MIDGPVLDVPQAARDQWALLLRQPPSGALGARSCSRIAGG